MKEDKDIVTALKCCAEHDKNMLKCCECPYFGNYSDCTIRLIKGANDLVRRLTGRNERLKKKNKELGNK